MKQLQEFAEAAAHPREEMPAGWKAQASNISRKIMPDLIESISANIANREQFEKGAPCTDPCSQARRWKAVCAHG
ncbi:hypothetical protein ACXR0O_26925 [Verrucomicrobiota bacterium sgz303538]